MGGLHNQKRLAQTDLSAPTVQGHEMLINITTSCTQLEAMGLFTREHTQPELESVSPNKEDRWKCTSLVHAPHQSAEQLLL